MTLYEFLLSFHILAAVVWIGGAVTMSILSVRVLRSSTAERIATFASDVEWIGQRVFMPASLTLILFAIGLMFEGNWSWGEFWIVIALVIYVASFAAGAGFFGPESGRISALVRVEGADSPDAQARIRRILMLSRLELVLLILAVLDMAVKPTSDDTGVIVVGFALALAAGALVIRVSSRAGSASGLGTPRSAD